MGDAVGPKPFVVTDANNDGFVSEGEGITITAPGAKESYAFTASATPPADPKIRKALHRIGLHPARLLGASIPNATRFATAVSDCYTAWSKNKLDREAAWMQSRDAYDPITEKTLDVLEQEALTLTFADASRLNELRMLPTIRYIETTMRGADWTLRELHNAMVSLVCEPYPVPGLKGRLKKIMSGILTKIENELPTLSASFTITYANMSALEEIASQFRYMMDIAHDAGIQDPALVSRLVPVQTQLVALLSTQRDAFSDYVEKNSRCTFDYHYEWTLSNYASIMGTLRDKQVPGAETLISDYDARYKSSFEYVTAIRVARSDRSDRIPFLQRAMDLRAKPDTPPELLHILALDVIQALSIGKVSEAKAFIEAVETHGLTLTPAQYHVWAQTLSEETTKAVKNTNAVLDAYTPMSGTTSPTKTLKALSEQSSPLAVLQEIADKLLPRLAPVGNPASAPVDVKPVYARMYALLTSDAFFTSFVLEHSVGFAHAQLVAGNFRAAATTAGFSSQSLTDWRKSYLTLVNRSFMRGHTHPDKRAAQQARQAMKTKFTTAIAHCNALIALDAAFGNPDANVDTKRAAVEAVEKSAKALGLTDFTFLNFARRELG